MHFSKAKGIGAGVAAVLIGAVAGLALRLVQMLCFFDYGTGFYTDGGVTAWLGLLLPVAGAVFAAILFYRGQSGFETFAFSGGIPAGSLAGVSGVVLLVQAVRMLADYREYQKSGLSAYESVQQGFIHMAFLVMCGIFGLVQLALAAGLVTGKNLFVKVPLLYLVAVFWGGANMIMVYVFYAKFSSVIENIFSMVGAAALLLGLLYLCKVFAGTDVARAMKYFFITGGLAVGLTVPYTLTNAVVYLTGRTYSGEMPIGCQLCGLSVALFIAAMMLSCCQGGPMAPRAEE